MPETSTIMEVPNSPKVKRLLFKGLTGADVKYVQECLDNINEVYPFYPFDSLENTGTFGRKTLSFVKFFQMYCNLPEHGSIDRITMNEIEKRCARLMTMATDPFDRY